MTPEPRMSCPGCISFVTHALTLVVLSSTVILNVISPTKFRGWPFASNRATGPGYSLDSIKNTVLGPNWQY